MHHAYNGCARCCACYDGALLTFWPPLLIGLLLLWMELGVLLLGFSHECLACHMTYRCYPAIAVIFHASVDSVATTAGWQTVDDHGKACCQARHSGFSDDTPTM